MTLITHSGYGYSKRLCENVCCWFFQNFLSKYEINLEIIHRGLKRENVYGYCDFTGRTYRPRNFVVELDTYMPKDLYIETLLHELTHLQQWVNGSLQKKFDQMYYKNVCISNMNYNEQPHEIEAFQNARSLLLKYQDNK